MSFDCFMCADRLTVVLYRFLWITKLVCELKIIKQAAVIASSLFGLSLRLAALCWNAHKNCCFKSPVLLDRFTVCHISFQS